MEKYLEVLQPIANEMGLNIVDIERVNNDLLDISIARQDFAPVDLDLCATAAEAFGEAIDFEISLDVGSAGAERIIESEDYESVVDQYVYIQFKNPFKNADYVEGTVTAVTDDEVVVSYRQKTALREVTIERLNIKMLRLAVKV
ncbi:ribosome assembly cofactor RimP [Erysipelothrix sp. HDW6C]|uniref:ribosome assembly cofactor RimP n=1 Tax=Erysipelothrix sp. HDW6C TaxID=2714930 RepID=UPI00140728AE|nr:ribosome assembly cofactor RimP [Erysipelothrix sp. HDW6C]QIK70084.1 ribosome assembly cofactor RimP [Erysipelothrix sp. HDW6C]